MLRKLLSIALYTSLFLVSTLVFTYFSFPLDQFREFIEHKANSSSKYRLEVGSIEREGMKALVLEEVSLGLNKKLFRRPSTKGKPVMAQDDEDDKDDDAEENDEREMETGAGNSEEFSFFTIDYLRLEFNLLQLLSMKEATFRLEMEMLGGAIEEGTIILKESVGFSRPYIDLPEITQVDLGSTEFFAALFSAVLPSLKTEQVSGSLESGFVSLTPKEEDETQYYEGELEFELEDIVAIEPLLSSRLRNAGTVEVPLTDMRLGSCVFKIRLDRKDKIEALDKVRTKQTDGTVILFERGECKGESLDYFVQENSFILLPTKGSMMKGQMELWTKLAFSPDYFDEKRVVDGNVVTKNKELGQGLEFDRRWQRSRDADGYYWMHCKGRLSKPRCRRQLPPEEKRRLKQKEELERQRKMQQQKAKPKLTTPRPPEDSSARPDRPDSDAVKATPEKKKSVFDRRREAAQKRAERMKKRQEQNRLRKERFSNGNDEPEEELPPDEEELPPEDDEEYLDDEPLPEDEEYIDEEGYDDELPPEELEDGELPLDEEPLEGEEPLPEDEEYLEEGEEPLEDELPPEEGEEPEMAPFP